MSLAIATIVVVAVTIAAIAIAVAAILGAIVGLTENWQEHLIFVSISGGIALVIWSFYTVWDHWHQ